jgi:hypothetical protein
VSPITPHGRWNQSTANENRNNNSCSHIALRSKRAFTGFDLKVGISLDDDKFSAMPQRGINEIPTAKSLHFDFWGNARLLIPSGDLAAEMFALVW